jgi:hypothetical protein
MLQTERAGEFSTTAFNFLPAERFSSVLIKRISVAREEISAIKRSGFVLGEQGDHYIRGLHMQTNADLVSLLALRRRIGAKEETGPREEDAFEEDAETALEREISVEFSMYPGEILHPFSSNKVYIAVPSPKYPGFVYRIFASLYDLRGKGVSNSIEAMELIGDKVTLSKSIRSDFLIQTEEELLIVRARKKTASIGNGKYSLEELDRIEQDLLGRKHLATTS